MELKGRLKLIADKAPKCDVLCDVGTDHGYIPIYLVRKNICKRAIAADIKIGPLEAAKEHIEKFGLKDRIETRLGNGLEPISAGEADTIIIAGMGGNLISSILQNGLDRAKAAKNIILQPMNDADIIREWLFENGFEIYDEELVEEGIKLYNVICATWKGIKNTFPSKIYKYIGEKLILKKDPLVGKLISRKATQLEKSISELKNAGESGKKVLEDYTALLKEIRDLERNL